MKKVMFASAVISVLALGLSVVPAFASQHHDSNSNSGAVIVIASSNNASVSNNVDASASTGKNVANGGNGKSGGAGGFIGTGDASSVALVLNTANSNQTTLGDCLCNGKTKSVTIASSNSASVTNSVDASAKTGGNTANGGAGSSSNNDSRHHSSQGGNGGAGGTIYTGAAGTGVDVENYLNSNVTSL